MEHWDGKKKYIEEHQSRMRSWIAKQLKKFNKIVKTEINFKGDNSIDSLKDGMKLFFQTLASQLDIAEKEVLPSEKDTSLMNMKDSEKMTRIKPKRARKNSMNEQIFDVDEEDLPTNLASNQFAIQTNNQTNYKIKENKQLETTKSS